MCLQTSLLSIVTRNNKKRCFAPDMSTGTSNKVHRYYSISVLLLGVPPTKPLKEAAAPPTKPVTNTGRGGIRTGGMPQSCRTGWGDRMEHGVMGSHTMWLCGLIYLLPCLAIHS